MKCHHLHFYILGSCRDSLSEVGREEDGYREDLCSIKSDSDTIRAESPDSSRGDSNSEYSPPPPSSPHLLAYWGNDRDHVYVFFR